MRRNGNTVKKTYNLPKDLIALMKRHFKVKTETEAIILAMKEIAFMDEVEHGLKKISGRFPRFKSIFR